MCRLVSTYRLSQACVTLRPMTCIDQGGGMLPGDLNSLVAWIYRHANVSGTPAPLSMALELGIQLVAIPVGASAALLGDSIIWDPTPRLARQQALVLREICRWALREHRLNCDSQTSTELAMAFNAYASRLSNVRSLSVCRDQSESYQPRPLAKVLLHDATRHPVLRSGTRPAAPRSR